MLIRKAFQTLAFLLGVAALTTSCPGKSEPEILVRDAGIDAGVLARADAGSDSPDASVVLDAGDDAGVVGADAGVDDSGVRADAGQSVDAGSAVDAGQLVQITSVASLSSTCASNSLGHVFCWGEHGISVIRPYFPESKVPLQVPGISDAKAVSVTGFSGCALTMSGGVKCWGDNRVGQLGNETLVSSAMPVDVKGISGAKAISGTCVINSQDLVQCWGLGIYGQLGNGSAQSSSVPVDVINLGPVKSLTTGSFFLNCAVTMNDTVKCWGLNANGILGGNSPMSIPTPTPVELPPGLTGVASIAVGNSAFCALLKTGELKCWSYKNDHGILGNGTMVPSLVPTVPTGLGLVTKAVMGASGACALEGGALKYWGRAFFDPATNSDDLVPRAVDGLGPGVVGPIAVGYQSVCAVVGGTSLKCWGANDQSQLGNGGDAGTLIPTEVLGLSQ
jgi:Regulator of chromosome condensation (RCC1) repeat